MVRGYIPRYGSPPRRRTSRPTVSPAGALAAGAGRPHRARQGWAERPIHSPDADCVGSGRSRASAGGGGFFDAGLDVADQFCAPAGAGLVPDPLQMRSDRVDRQEQPLGDLGVGRPAGQQRHDLPLSCRQRADGAVCRRLTGGGNGGCKPTIGLGCCTGQGDGIGLAERAALPVSGPECGVAQRGAQTGMVAVA